MRAAVLAGAMLIAAPLSAQDHAGHGAHSGHAGQAQVGPDTAIDHCAMGHLPPEQCPSREPDETGHPGHDANRQAPPALPASHSGHGAHSGHAAPADKSAPGAAPESAIPPRAFAGPRHAADAVWGTEAMAPSRRQLARENGGMRTGMVMAERLEARIPADRGEDGFVWDGQAFFGGDIDRLVVKTEGEGAFAGAIEDAEIQALYSRAIGPFFDLQAGLRLDIEPETRPHLALGVQGLAPYMIHLDAALFVSDKGDVTARVEAEYDQRITQRLILQPRIEAELSAQAIPERETGAGLTHVAPGLRLRYEIVPEFAPYVGAEYEAKTGRTAELARASGEETDALVLVAGLRFWF
ncbi:copper resistance protein B [Qipengyuania nanhaisediminis]|uniref:copper resistance protein B n=1 Tax=Qipengyuania nanhaisediminis TaxID=604088 RepID=UPI0038B32021